MELRRLGSFRFFLHDPSPVSNCVAPCKRGFIIVIAANPLVPDLIAVVVVVFLDIHLKKFLTRE